MRMSAGPVQSVIGDVNTMIYGSHCWYYGGPGHHWKKNIFVCKAQLLCWRVELFAMGAIHLLGRGPTQGLCTSSVPWGLKWHWDGALLYASPLHKGGLPGCFNFFIRATVHVLLTLRLKFVAVWCNSELCCSGLCRALFKCESPFTICIVLERCWILFSFHCQSNFN